MALPQKIRAGAAEPVSLIPFLPMGRHLAEALGATVFAPTPEPEANYILAQALAQNIRYTVDGGQPPTAAIGFQLLTGDAPLLIPMGGNRVVRFIREASGAVLQYQFGRA